MSILIMGACHMLVLSITCGSYSCHGLGNHVHSRHGFMSHTGVIHNMCSYSYHGWGNMSIHIMGPSHMLVLSITCGSYSYHGLGDSCPFLGWIHVTCCCSVAHKDPEHENSVFKIHHERMSYVCLQSYGLTYVMCSYISAMKSTKSLY
jgi:hypothetical protein